MWPGIEPAVYGAIVGVTGAIGLPAIVAATRSALRGRPIDGVGSGA
ncbi:hypothetical protein [Amycolatopsis sp. H20-H5]|nr:hypothetical protein [Amycolatopsis sp. H20-H5]MEC3981812.1 hypothetical protein [Amycolatopsis sp. H20-H5]